LLPWIGFYLDDWYLIWFKHAFGAFDLIKYFNLDRPLMSYFYIAANFILGGSERPIVWQIFGVFTRWLSVVALWQMLNTIWPNARRQNTLVALLAAVYPGFTQQWIAVIYSFFFSCLAGFFFSISLMLKAFRTTDKIYHAEEQSNEASPPNSNIEIQLFSKNDIRSALSGTLRSHGRFLLYYVGSILIMAYVIPASEFFAGLEFIRLIVLWFEFNKEGEQSLDINKKIIKYSFPYLLILILFLAWRVFYFRSINHALAVKNWFQTGIFDAVAKNFNYFFRAIMDGTINSWTNPFQLDNYPEKGLMALVIFSLVVVMFFLVLFWLDHIQGSNAEKEAMGAWRKQAPLISIISLILAVIPFWSSGLPFDSRFPYDRFLLAMLFGSCLLVVWLFESLGYNEKKTILVISLLVSFGMGYQISNANFYKNIWSMQKRFLWELNWRIPDLVPNTMIQTYQFPETNYWTGQALTAFLNWTYSDEMDGRKIDHLFFIENSGQKIMIRDLRADQPIHIDFRTYTFDGNTSNSIFILFTRDACLRVIDSRVTPPETVIEEYEYPLSGVENSDLTRILNGDGGHIPRQVIGGEPDPGWCYFFEKAELARQEQDYTQVVALFEETRELNLLPLKLTEYYPFIDSYARTSDWSMAYDLTMELIPSASPALNKGLCHIWMDLGTDFPNQESTWRILKYLRCQF